MREIKRTPRPPEPGIHIIRAMDRFYAKHPHISFAIAVAAVVAIMWITSEWDRADTAALRLQMWASKGAV